MAEINVPACPIPTQNTKFVMYVAQPDRDAQPGDPHAGLDLVDPDPQRGQDPLPRSVTMTR